MSSISVPDGVKNEFKDLMPEDCDSQGDFVRDLLGVYRAMQNGGLDHEEIIEAIDTKVAATAETAAFRAIAEHLDEQVIRRPNAQVIDPSEVDG